MSFQLTDAGRAAITDAANRRTNQVTLTRMAAGDGLAQAGVSDGGRAALRNERQRQDLATVAGGVARIGVRASFTGMIGDPVWSATELGLIARVGAGPEFLAAYGAVEAGADPYAVVAPGVSAVIAATVDVVVSAAAVAVTVTPNVTVGGASTFAALLDTPAALSPGAYYRGNSAGSALESVSPAALLADLAPHIVQRLAWDGTRNAPSDGSWAAVPGQAQALDVPVGWTVEAYLRGRVSFAVRSGDPTPAVLLGLLRSDGSVWASVSGSANLHAPVTHGLHVLKTNWPGGVIRPGVSLRNSDSSNAQAHIQRVRLTAALI